MKELFIECHEQLVAEYTENHPEVTEDRAYDITAEWALDRMTDKLADMGDHARMKADAETNFNQTEK